MAPWVVMPAVSTANASSCRPNRIAARCCNSRLLSAIVGDGVAGRFAMSEIDEAEPPRWLAVADFPLIALMRAVLLYAVATTLGHFVSGLIAPLGQPADAALHMLVMLVSVLPVYKLAISRLGERPRDDLPRATALPELAKGAAAGA